MAQEPITVVGIKRDDLLRVTPAVITPPLIVLVTPVISILIRSARVFLQVVLGLLSAKMVGLSGDTLPAHDFMHLFKDCAGLAVGAAVVCAMQNAGELLAKLDQKFPLSRG